MATLISISILAALSTGGLFLEVSNLLNVAERASIIGIVALGQALVIMTGGIDLSVGAIMCTALALTSKTTDLTGSVTIGIIVSMVVCALVGLINGLLISKTKMPAFIVTIGTMMVFKSFAIYITGSGQLVFTKLQGTINSTLNLTPTGSRLLPTVSWILLSLIFIFILARTKLGLNIFATGSNETTAKYSGVKTSSVKVLVYVFAGFFSAVAAIIYAYRLSGASPDAGLHFQMESIAAVILGGTSLKGGEGSVFGSMFGALVMAILVNLMNLLGVDPFIQDGLKGLVLIVFVYLLQLYSKKY
ncbi:MAG: ABC transporter permease [Bacteroidales bacterium]|nr:ABC transporter permease [Bacteroidales bacterium]